jgi:hypothetical protein
MMPHRESMSPIGTEMAAGLGKLCEALEAGRPVEDACRVRTLRRVGGRIVVTDSRGPEGVVGRIGPMPEREGGR